MASQQFVHSTDDVVTETGEYTCEAGTTRKLYKGDKFPSCPETEIITYWKHVESHHHHSGDEVMETGRYIDEDGDELHLEAGSIFPSCPKHGTPTKWQHAEG